MARWGKSSNWTRSNPNDDGHGRWNKTDKANPKGKSKFAYTVCPNHGAGCPGWKWSHRTGVDHCVKCGTSYKKADENDSKQKEGEACADPPSKDTTGKHGDEQFAVNSNDHKAAVLTILSTVANDTVVKDMPGVGEMLKRIEELMKAPMEPSQQRPQQVLPGTLLEAKNKLREAEKIWKTLMNKRDQKKTKADELEKKSITAKEELQKAQEQHDLAMQSHAKHLSHYHKLLKKEKAVELPPGIEVDDNSSDSSIDMGKFNLQVKAEDDPTVQNYMKAQTNKMNLKVNRMIKLRQEHFDLKRRNTEMTNCLETLTSTFKNAQTRISGKADVTSGGLGSVPMPCRPESEAVSRIFRTGNLTPPAEEVTQLDLLSTPARSKVADNESEDDADMNGPEVEAAAMLQAARAEAVALEAATSESLLYAAAEAAAATTTTTSPPPPADPEPIAPTLPAPSTSPATGSFMESLTAEAVELACEEYRAGKGSQGKGKGGSDFRHSEYAGEGIDLEAPETVAASAAEEGTAAAGPPDIMHR